MSTSKLESQVLSEINKADIQFLRVDVSLMFHALNEIQLLSKSIGSHYAGT